MASPLVSHSRIQSAELLTPLPLWSHTYVWPFTLIWPVFFHYYFSTELYNKYIQAPEWTFVWILSIVTAQALVWLCTHWSVSLKARFTAKKARSVEDARLIKVIPVANAGAADICPLIRTQICSATVLYFLFQKRRFLYNPETKAFVPLTYDIDSEPKPKLAKFQMSKGIATATELSRLERHYGTNTFDIPVPTFAELFKEHAVAPFFVFQIFCVGLWMLDDYWYYSLFTLFMLVMFESTVVWQRQRTMTEFRSMSIKPYDMWAHRLGQWMEISSDKLLPGDLVSVTRTKEDSGVACDMLLVEGAVIVNEAMLSGESTPLLKDSIQLRPGDAPVDPDGLDKNVFLWGGTKVLQVTHANTEEAPTQLASGVSPPPDKGAMAIVVKTGFETSQGSLVRTMIYSTERVSANNAEALFFILFLLVFAVAASWYVWTEGVQKDRKRSKLLLDCILIVTSVVPPELPMELSLAVNTSLSALAKFAIFCTEPFRIPFAGRIDVACFDKTGTLTGEDLVVEGIAGLSDNVGHMTPAQEAGMETTLILASAHALVKLDEGEIVGDPMEKATLTALGWRLGKNDTLFSKASGENERPLRGTVHVKRRFQFSSALKRQSSIAAVHAEDRASGRKMQGTFVGVKGAPETIMKMLVSVPSHYEATFKHFTRRGSRVLALAYKQLTVDNEMRASKINDLKREDVEAELHFAGFLVLQCPLKEDAKLAIRMLSESSHRVVMITGDNPLTAVHVAREVEIVDRGVLILDAPEQDDGQERLIWRSIDDSVSIDVDPTQPIAAEVFEKNDICVTGYALAKFKDQVGWKSLLRHTWVYARVSPKQKEDILLGLKNMGYFTLMAGDGTNDVGALKQAHIGVALLNGTKEDLVRIAEHARNTRMKDMYQKQVGLMKRWNQPAPPVPVLIAHLYPPGPSNPHYEKAMQRESKKQGTNVHDLAKKYGHDRMAIETISSPGAQRLTTSDPRQARQMGVMQQAQSFSDRIQESMMESEMNDEPPTLKLGDASVAAPFTSKLRNVMAIPDIVRQGRCTLVATIQMYKILALNCLISAYSLSVLYLEGIKFGDGQITISGMLMSVCFLSISRARSVEGLSKERPQSNIFNFYIIGSILGQFAVHVATLIYIARVCDKLQPRMEEVDLEAEFSPSLLNSAIYLLQLIQQISTFAVNYQGRPFRESLTENKGMFYGILGVTGIAFACSTETVLELNDAMKLVSFPIGFSSTMTVIMILDFMACWAIEVVFRALFSDLRARDIAMRRPDQVAREKARKEEAKAQRLIEEEKKRMEKVAEFERRIEARVARVREWTDREKQQT